jgi:hypothetical protein
VTIAIEVAAIIFSAVAVVLAVLSMRLNAKTDRTYRRMEERERSFYSSECESPWKSLSRERWDADHGTGDFDRRLAESREPHAR